MIPLDSRWKALISKAKKVRKNAYAPYSGHQVGAALELSNGQIIEGCNVENSSYGATVCAERVAIQTAVARFRKIRIRRIVVVTDAHPAWPPCGMCRQVMAEFASSNTPILLTNLKNQVRRFTLADLLPEAFTPGHLAD